MNKPNSSVFKKAALSASVAAALSVGVAQNAQADIYEFSYANGGCNVAGLVDANSDGDYADAALGDVNNTCTGAGDSWFTMLDSSGTQLQNSSYPYYGDPTWGYGLRTQIGGTIALDVTPGKDAAVGGATINGFDFFAGGAAVASSIEMQGVGNGQGGSGGLMLTNMGFAWNGSTITTQVVLDAAGLLAEIPADTDASTLSIGTVIDSNSCTASGACATPASDGIKKGKYPLGPVPVATSTFNTAGQTGVATVLADLTLGTDDGIGGSPMDNGPFSGFNANFDFGVLTLTGYNDTTPPVVSFSSPSVSIALNGTFDPLTPGVTVTCTDRADGTGDKVDGALSSTNSKLTFAFNQADVNAIDSTVSGSYDVRYTCTDSALARANGSTGVQHLPAGSAAPADNTSADTVLKVLVADPNAPTIVVTGDNPLQAEACTVYNDLGATATDPQDGTVPVTSIDNDGVEGTSPLDGVVATFTYNATDTSGLPAVPATRVVNFVDTVPPTLSVETVAAGVTGVDVNGVITFNIESRACDAFNASLPTATVTDSCSTPAQTTVAPSNTVNCTVLDGSDTVETTLLYSGTDGANNPNTGSTTAKVIVSRSEPIATLVGNANVILEEVNGAIPAYVEQGVAIHDVQDGDITATAAGTVQGVLAGGGAGGDITVTITIKDPSGAVVNSIDTSVSGVTYTITYDVVDSDGLSATQLERQVTVGAYATGSNFTMLNPQGNWAGGTNDVVVVWDGVSLNTDETDTNFGLMSIKSALPQPFFEYLWTAHHIRVYGPGTYTFDVTCTTAELEAGTKVCSDGVSRFVGNQTEQFLTMEVKPGQIGAHILFDWGRPNDPAKPDTITPCGVASCDIDVVVVWDQNALWDQQSPLHLGDAGSPPDVASPWKLVSTDADNDGINGVPMIDGPFIGFNANFNIGPEGTLTELPTIQIQAQDTALGEDGIGSMGLGLLGSLSALLGFGLFRRNRK